MYQCCITDNSGPSDFYKFFLIFTCSLSNDCSGGMENFWVLLDVLIEDCAICGLILDKYWFGMIWNVALTIEMLYVSQKTVL